MDLQSLLDAASDPAPCGPDLEYDAAFLALESEVQGKPEREIAGKIIEAVEPDWPRVRSAAEALLARSKDLRLAVHLLRALTHTEQLHGFVAGMRLLGDLVERYWPDLHPGLDHENGDDPTARMNVLAALEAPRGVAGVETLLRDLRDAHVVPAGAQGTVTVRDILVAEGRLPAVGEATPAAALLDRLRVAVERDGGLRDGPDNAVAALTRLRDLLVDKVGADRAPDVRAALDMLKTVALVMKRAIGVTSPQDAAAGSPGDGGGVAAPVTGDLRGRDDVSRAIDRICAYLERTEPGNPAPLLMRRAQRLLNKNFVDLIEDLAPESLAQVKAIAGLKDQ